MKNIYEKPIIEIEKFEIKENINNDVLSNFETGDGENNELDG